MERINRIWHHKEYQKCLASIGEWERERKFCRHSAEHFLDVARLAYVLALENGLDIEKELIYGAALLPDIGRHLQYEQGISHEEAGAHIAERILKDCGFTGEESGEILAAIKGHRTKQGGLDLPGILYRADKLSRNCFCCPAEAECNWAAEKKNLSIRY